MPTLATNKSVRFDYEILDTFEGGLVLTGAEVKSVKAGAVQLKGAFLHLRGSALWLKNAHVSPYKPAGAKAVEAAQRDRKVLVHKHEIKRLVGKLQQEGLTLVPLSLYTKGGLVKIEFGLGRGKKKFEKREMIKKRDVKRQIHQTMRES